MKIQCPIGVGELVDKISILEIKKDRIKDQDKLQQINNELVSLRAVIKSHAFQGMEKFINDLIDVNGKLWDIEDAIRLKEKKKDFGSEFIALARQVYVMNDQRFALKDKVNAHFGSDIIEVKSYEKY